MPIKHPSKCYKTSVCVLLAAFLSKCTNNSRPEHRRRKKKKKIWGSSGIHSYMENITLHYFLNYFNTGQLCFSKLACVCLNERWYSISVPMCQVADFIHLCLPINRKRSLVYAYVSRRNRYYVTFMSSCAHNSVFKNLLLLTIFLLLVVILICMCIYSTVSLSLSWGLSNTLIQFFVIVR